MNILFLRGFNNYFNRIVKKHRSLDDYRSDSMDYLDFDNINFNPNDGVVTELIIGNTAQTDIDHEDPVPLNFDEFGTPDYAICYEGTSIIKYRWFVLETERLRTGQYRLALKRDVVADHYNTIVNAPCFIEKGIISTINNPLLYNKESMTYNQIKTAEYPLKDSTGSGWIVGYISKDVPNSSAVSGKPNITTEIIMEGTPTEYYEESDLPFSVSTTGSTRCYHYTPNEYRLIFSYAGIGYRTLNANLDYAYRYRGVAYMDVTATSVTKGGSSLQFNTSAHYGENTNTVNTLINTGFNKNSTYVLDGYTITGDTSVNATYLFNKLTGRSGGGCLNGPKPMSTIFTNGFINIPTSFYSNEHVVQLRNYITTQMSGYSGVVTDASMLDSYNGKIVKIGSYFYQMSIVQTGLGRRDIFRASGSTTSLSSGMYTNNYHSTSQYTTYSNAVRDDINAVSLKYNSGASGSYVNYLTNHGGALVCVTESIEYRITLSPIRTETLSLTNREYSSRTPTYDSPADIFAIPYGNVRFKVGSSYFTTNSSRGLAMGRAIMMAMGENGAYDLQLVPYCPSQIVRDYIAQDGYLDTSNLNSNSIQTFTTTSAGGTSSTAGFVLWCSSCKGTFDIDLAINPDVPYSGTLSLPLRYKLSNETQLCRLASPNFNGQFEFSIAKNHGVDKFNVDYTYKPYTPYIHVNPNFGGLYGQDWDDARGLICGGDFSVGYMSSYWQTYLNNNKNYSQIFDRQIQNMDVNNSIALEKQEFQATVGTITSAIGGVMGGAAAGATAGSAAGPWGTLIGGVVGAVGGGIGSGMAAAYGAAKDKDWLLRQQAESRSFAVDMYGYQLGNIQAIPYSLKGTDSLTNNNKIWPIVELYGPTEDEINFLRQKIQYDGMTVMAVGLISEYLNNEDFGYVYVKGRMIRIADNDSGTAMIEDFHMVDAIYQEISKGVYIPSGGL